MKDMLDILLLGLVGKELTFLELDKELTSIGIPSELDWISDWKEIIETGMILYQANENGDNHYGIYFDVISMNEPDEPYHCILVKIIGIELN